MVAYRAHLWPAPWCADSTAQLCSEGPVTGLKLHCHSLGILSTFWTRESAFSFCPGHHELLIKNPGNAGDTSLIPGSVKIPWSRKWHPTPVFLPGKSHGQRSLVGYRPQGYRRAGHDLVTKLIPCLYTPSFWSFSDLISPHCSSCFIQSLTHILASLSNSWRILQHGKFREIRRTQGKKKKRLRIHDYWSRRKSGECIALETKRRKWRAWKWWTLSNKVQIENWLLNVEMWRSAMNLITAILIELHGVQ